MTNPVNIALGSEESHSLRASHELRKHCSARRGRLYAAINKEGVRIEHGRANGPQIVSQGLQGLGVGGRCHSSAHFNRNTVEVAPLLWYCTCLLVVAPRVLDDSNF
jgi:hypothetical protein